ncbi:MAG: DinB family protein [Bacteroidota bacterium]|nr:DinB family protein [Bacteroidota bacterium]
MTVSQFLNYAQGTLAPTESLFLLVPSDKIGWKPTERSFTLGQLMHHMAAALQFNADGIGKNEWALPSMRHIFVANRKISTVNVDEALKLYHQSAKIFLDIFSSISDDEFQTGEVDSIQLGRVQKWRIALFAVDHHLRHMTELFMYLKVLGLNISSKELYGAGEH